jgi:hypothetical protein
MDPGTYSRDGLRALRKYCSQAKEEDDLCECSGGVCRLRQKAVTLPRSLERDAESILSMSGKVQIIQHSLSQSVNPDEQSCLQAQERIYRGKCDPKKSKKCCPRSSCILYTAKARGVFGKVRLYQCRVRGVSDPVVDESKYYTRMQYDETDEDSD